MTATDDEHWIDEDEAACRLLLQIGNEIPAGAPDCDQVAGFVTTTRDAAIALELRMAAHAAGKALILVDGHKLATEVDADGVLLSEPGDVAQVRAASGPDRLVGAVCGASRHDAMVAGEAGADYVTFGSLAAAASVPFELLIELAEWWSDLAVIPAVVASAVDAAQVRTLALTGAGFVLPTQSSLSNGAMDRAELDALAIALADPRVP